ncbi:MAG: hypothetical protein H6779_00100 [Candidatus Nomurabacteria bacterium]|nr:MAG: hypothetical protein H6779_00100 [Candidatus Nomurabacteria bacterium]
MTTKFTTMILTLKRKTKKYIYLATVLSLVLLFSIPNSLKAQESLTLSVSPTLFDMSAEPGQHWQSGIKIINVNNYDLTVYANVVNFVPRGEYGEASFIPTDPNDTKKDSLAKWISITNEAIIIPREQTVEVPFSVDVPTDASPGGHYAAIMIGTKPPREENKETRVQTSQIVTALLFTKIAGDIIELGDIREFRTTETFMDKPEATFEVRFENKGNVYIQPQGEIKITNMWGEERGIIPINQNSQYGKIPHKTDNTSGIRKYTFNWKGEWSLADIGRYTATVALGYGSAEKKFANAKTTFWVIPFKLLLSLLIGIAIFVYVFIWLVRLYIRKMLTMAGLDVQEYNNFKRSRSTTQEYPQTQHDLRIHAPVKQGIKDLKDQLSLTSNTMDYIKTFLKFCYKNRLFILGVAMVIALVSSLIWYFKSANTDHRAYEVTYVNSDENVNLSSEDIIYNELVSDDPADSIVISEEINKKTPITIINRSGVPGIGAEAKITAEKNSFAVSELKADFSSSQAKTVILYTSDNQEEALRLSKLFNNALISINDESEHTSGDLIIYLGSDMAD